MNEPITLAIVNARIQTTDARRPWADALAVRGTHIALLGASAEIRKHVPATARVVDARGATIISASGAPLSRADEASFTVVDGSRTVMAVIHGELQSNAATQEQG